MDNTDKYKKELDEEKDINELKKDLEKSVVDSESSKCMFNIFFIFLNNSFFFFFLIGDQLNQNNRKNTPLKKKHKNSQTKSNYHFLS